MSDMSDLPNPFNPDAFFAPQAEVHLLAGGDDVAEAGALRDEGAVLIVGNQFSDPLNVDGAGGLADPDIPPAEHHRHRLNPDVVAHHVQPGRIHDDYILHWMNELGCGVNGAVVVAECRRSGAQYALKVIPETEDAWREIAIQHQLSERTPNVLGIQGVYRERHLHRKNMRMSSHLFVVMQMAVCDLFTHVKQHGVLSEQQCCKIIAQVSDALQHMHVSDLVHCDIKLENILVDHDMNAYLCDFGYVGRVGLRNARHSPAYASPEVVRSIESVEHYGVAHEIVCASDMWGLGVSMYAMLSCRFPFVSSLETAAQRVCVLQGRLVFDGPEWDGVSVQCREVIRQLLLVDPFRRMGVQELCAHGWLRNAAV
jgi:serine/threonine protein kinase